MNSTIIYYFLERDFEWPWLWDVNRGSLQTGSRRGRKKNIWRAKRVDERETEEFGERGDRVGALGLAGSLFASYDLGNRILTAFVD